MLKKTTIALLAAFACTACTATRTAHQLAQAYTPPAVPSVANSRTFENVSFDKAWEAIIQFFAEQQISIETLEKDSGIVVAKKMLTSGSDGDGIVKLGNVTSTRYILKQWLEPVRFEGSANAAVVRATGRVTKEERQPDPIVTSEPAACRSAVSFNVFVARFAEEKLKVTINVNVSTADSLKLWNGWVWHDFLEGAPIQSTDRLISLLQAHVQPTPTNPEPVTTGQLEGVFLDHLQKALAPEDQSKEQ